MRESLIRLSGGLARECSVCAVIRKSLIWITSLRKKESAIIAIHRKDMTK